MSSNDLSADELKFIRSMTPAAYVVGSATRRAWEILHRLADKAEERQFLAATERLVFGE